MCNSGDAKIGEHDFPLWANEHIGRLDITMDEPLSMGILKGLGNLFYVGDDSGQRHTFSPWMPLAERATRVVLHHQEGYTLLNIEIKYVHNMRMLKGCNGVRFLLEGINILLRNSGMQDLDRCELLLEPEMLPQIDRSLAPLSKYPEQAIVAELLTTEICHDHGSSLHASLTIQW